MTQHANHSLIDLYLPTAFKAYIEQEYYQKVTVQSLLENLEEDESFLDSPLRKLKTHTPVPRLIY